MVQRIARFLVPEQRVLGPGFALVDGGLQVEAEACEDLMLQRSVQFLLCYGHPEVHGRLGAESAEVLWSLVSGEAAA